jgi:parallel beta-helix repeat protein
MLSRNNVTLRNAYITAFNDGIHLSSSSNCQIIQSTLTGNAFYGLGLYDSSYNNIAKNNFTANKWVALNLASSLHNSIDTNQMVGNNYALELVDSSYNSITGNTVIDNTNGIELSNSQNNSIFHNNFINHTLQVTLVSSVGIWDEGYPSGGNYWADNPNRTDSFRGPNQDQPGSDGICDTPYSINLDNQDRYPLMNAYAFALATDLNKDGKVNIVDITLIAQAFSSSPGDARWNPICDLDHNDVVNIVDITMVAKDFGKTT